MTHRDGFPSPQALGKPPPVGQANRQWASVRASESLDDVPHRPRLPSCPPLGPTDRQRDLYGSIIRTFGITPDSAAALLTPPNRTQGADTVCARKRPRRRRESP